MSWRRILAALDGKPPLHPRGRLIELAAAPVKVGDHDEAFGGTTVETVAGLDDLG